MSLSLSQSVLRRQIINNGRCIKPRSYATSTTEVAKEKASQASQGLSKAASQAGNYASQAAGAAGKALGGIGGTTGRIIGAVQGMIPPTIYYSRVGLEVGKLVFEQRKMSPPSAQTFQNYWSGLTKYLSQPSAISNAASGAASSPQSLLNRVQGLDRAQMITLGVIGAELLGFFTVGEIIGKFKVVGYRSAQQTHHDD